MKTKSIAAILFVIFFLISMAPAARAASSTVTTISASADTYVDSAKPTANFGGIATMWIRGGHSHAARPVAVRPFRYPRQRANKLCDIEPGCIQRWICGRGDCQRSERNMG